MLSHTRWRNDRRGGEMAALQQVAVTGIGVQRRAAGDQIEDRRSIVGTRLAERQPSRPVAATGIGIGLIAHQTLISSMTLLFILFILIFILFNAFYPSISQETATESPRLESFSTANKAIIFAIGSLKLAEYGPAASA
jgi:hypothetical protein